MHRNRQRLNLASVFFTTFLLSLAVYVVTLAPTVTFEDSGELITAAFHLGVPHQPGYPLFTILGRFFAMLPLGDVAWQLNFMSAFFASLGNATIAVCTWLVLSRFVDEFAYDNIYLQIFRLVTSICAGLLAMSSFENWEQSIITEVYGLNTFLVSTALLTAILWYLQTNSIVREKLFLLTCYIIGLSLTNHTTALMLIPILGAFVLAVNYKYLLNIKRLAAGLGSMFLGLSLYLYLPFASLRNPLMDWGNPENWTNFWRTVSRHQYLLDEPQSWERFSAQFLHYIELLFFQWNPLILLLAVSGFFFLWKNQKSLFTLFAVFLLFSAPIMTFLTNFDVSIGTQHVVMEHKTLVSVFYIPSYLVLAILISIGLFNIGKLVILKNPKPYLVYLLLFISSVLPSVFIYNNFPLVNMRNYTFARDFVDNMFNIADQNSIIFADWDPYYFPTNYSQFVKNKRRDILVIDQQLLRRSWYIEWLNVHYTEQTSKINSEITSFLKALEPFESGKEYNGNLIQIAYEAMINKFLDITMRENRSVYFTYIPKGNIAKNYAFEPYGAFYKLRFPKDTEVTPLSENILKVDAFFQPNLPIERMIPVFREYYGQLATQRAEVYTVKGLTKLAISQYNLAAKLMSHKPLIKVDILNKLEKLQ